ncbi:MAG TPA: GTPase HflX [Candidatus Nitrosocosmicus sp.]|nr:GTPase HflX [Candidatus Nitrosocosmicus sp.]
MSQILKQRFILISIVPPSFSKEEANDDLEELKSLVSTFGGATIVRVIQKRDRPDKHSFIGKGKVQEVVQMIKTEKIDIVVLNSVVSSNQLFELETEFWKSNSKIKVWDRIDLILNIFDKHASTAEAKLQIELARMRHMGPKIFGMGMIMSRQGGGIGTRGIGETNTELMKRHWRDATKKVQDQLKKLSQERERQIERRREIGFKTISIIGYTNAGKSSLFNLLSGKKKLAKDVLFATLDTTVGKLYLPNIRQEVLLSDTIGFIQKLPATLIDAFKSTLMESIQAQLLIHVIDMSDPKMYEKITVVEQVLQELGIEEKQRLYVFNKVDQAQMFNRNEIIEQFGKYNPLFISVKTEDGIKELVETIEQKIAPKNTV